MVKQRHLEAARDLLLRAGFSNINEIINNLTAEPVVANKTKFVIKLNNLSKQKVAKQLEYLDPDSLVNFSKINKDCELISLILENEKQQSLKVSSSVCGDENESSGHKKQQNVSVSKNKEITHFFCQCTSLWKEYTFYSKIINNFYGAYLRKFESCDVTMTDDNVFGDCPISKLYLPFFKYDIDYLFSLFTALSYIYFDEVWLPPYEGITIKSLTESMQEYMAELAKDEDYDPFDIESVIQKVRFYSPGQVRKINDQREAFEDSLEKKSLKQYKKYINYSRKPKNLDQDKWNDLKAEAEKLMAVMRCEQFPEEKHHNDEGMYELMAGAIENNENLITNALRTRGLRIQDVTGDGNCGVYALLQGLAHNEGAKNQAIQHLQQSQNAQNFLGILYQIPQNGYGNVFQSDKVWNAADALRKLLPDNNPNREMATQENRDRWITDEDLKTFSRELGITIVRVSNLEDVITFASGEEQLVLLENVLERENAIILYNKDNMHYQTVVRVQNQDQPSSVKKK